MDADVARADVVEVMTSADQGPARESVWQSVDGAWRRVNGACKDTAARVARDQRCSSFERRVGARAVSNGGEASTNV